MKWLIFFGCLAFFDKSFSILGCTIPSFANLTVQSDFNLNKFLGIWYEIQWLPGEPHNQSDIWRNFYQSFQLVDSSTQKLSIPGKARLLNNDTCFSFGPWSIIANNSAKMILEKRAMTSNTSLNWPYYILKTDYENYALTYVCETINYIDTNPCFERILWVFSRTPTLSNTSLINLNNYIENQLCINLTDLEITPHDGVQCYSSTTNMNIFNKLFLIFLLFVYI